MPHDFWHAASEYSREEKRAVNPYGNITSLLDWCEEDLFAPIWFVAEFWNTVSNAVMFVLGLFGAYRCYKQGLALRFILGYLSLSLVGVGSAAFHGTLLFQSQLLDEIPMLITDAIFLYIIAPREWRNVPASDFKLVTGLVAYVVLVAGVYMRTRSALVFEGGYAAGALIVFARCLAWYRANSHNKRHDDANRVIVIGSVSFLGAFFLWNVDNQFCDRLRYLRKEVLPSLLAPFLQFHAVWHVGTGFGTYCLGVFVGYIAANEEAGDDAEAQLLSSSNAKSPKRRRRRSKSPGSRKNVTRGIIRFAVIPVLEVISGAAPRRASSTPQRKT